MVAVGCGGQLVPVREVTVVGTLADCEAKRAEIEAAERARAGACRPSKQQIEP